MLYSIYDIYIYIIKYSINNKKKYSTLSIIKTLSIIDILFITDTLSIIRIKFIPHL